MFLLILDDGQVYSRDIIDDGYRTYADNGVLDIIDISGDVPLQYYDGKWTKIEELKD